MKKNHLLPIATLSLFGLSTSVFAQSGTVINAAAPTTEAAPTQETTAVPTPNQIVYRSSLPSAQEVTNAAASQGLTVEQISQTANQVVAVYKTKSGQTMTVAYALLPNANGAAPTQTQVMTAAVEYAPSGTVISSAPTTTTTVVYTDPYYSYDPVYSPWYYGYGWGYPGVAVGIGFGGGYWYHGHYYRGGYYHGGYHGGGWAHPGGGHPAGQTPGGFHTGGGFHH